LFASDRKLLEDRGSLILRKLCVLLNAKRVYMALSEIVLEEVDTDFAAIFVQTLNLILLTAKVRTGIVLLAGNFVLKRPC
jgi:vacuole morphology and inheritance protein 14